MESVSSQSVNACVRALGVKDWLISGAQTQNFYNFETRKKSSINTFQTCHYKFSFNSAGTGLALPRRSDTHESILFLFLFFVFCCTDQAMGGKSVQERDEKAESEDLSAELDSCPHSARRGIPFPLIFYSFLQRGPAACTKSPYGFAGGFETSYLVSWTCIELPCSPLPISFPTHTLSPQISDSALHLNLQKARPHLPPHILPATRVK